MRSDNGTPFASTSAGRLSRLNVWWLKLGIMPERIEPGKPQQNGRHERMHRALKAETARPPAEDRQRQQRRFDRFRQEYNQDRPHEALGQQPPAASYETAQRPYPKQVPEPEYPGHWECGRGAGIEGCGGPKGLTTNVIFTCPAAKASLGRQLLHRPLV
jgi:putative transposase